MSQFYQQEPLTQLRLSQANKLIHQLAKIDRPNNADLLGLLRRFPDPIGGMFAKSTLNQAYQRLLEAKKIKPLTKATLNLFKKKPIRTLSGVAPITVLTKPFPCPGECIFCPSDIRMPKSYLASEPGAQRAERNFFNPYLQTINRLQALVANGHMVEKAELIVLGGTWSFYPKNYQIWFIKECFRALNDFGTEKAKSAVAEIEKNYFKLNQKLEQAGYHSLIKKDPAENQLELADKQIDGQKISQRYNQIVNQVYLEPEKALGIDQIESASWSALEKEQQRNETAKIRCVGLVLETRSDKIDEMEVKRLRRLGATKVQIGVQSLDDEVLRKNKRGHNVAATARAFKLLRLAGFKIHAHWMANLYGSTVAKDKKDYRRLFDDDRFKPDELKIYPTSLIASAELMQYYRRGLWRPYSHRELLAVLEFCLMQTPAYCRLTRVVRDIPSPDIVVGNKKTNFRQIVMDRLQQLDKRMQDIRAREIRNTPFKITQLKFTVLTYTTSVSQEKFLQFLVKTKQGEKLLAFLRLSLPASESFIGELKQAAIIREIHVYGRATALGQREKGKAQHLGLGRKLITQAKNFAHQAGYHRLAVISAVGTRAYYRRQGFTDGVLYQFTDCGKPTKNN